MFSTKDISKLEIVLDILLSGEDLPIKYKDHQLRGEFRDFRECHIEPDWLLIYRKEEDELIDVRLTDGEDNVVLVTKKGLSITFDEKDVRPVGRTAQGVIGMRLDSDDCVIGMEPIIVGSKAFLLAITENGFGKRTEVEEYRVQNRGGRGVITYKITPKTGDIVGIKIVSGEEDVMLITDTGTIIRLKVKDISILGRNTQGVTLMRMPEDTKLVSITVVSDEEDEKE